MYTIQFQTEKHTPPPYCYQVLCQFSIEEDSPKIQLQLQYFGREELAPNEILEEGFSEDDDISWQGKLPKVWVKAFDDLYAQTTWVDTPQGENYLGLVKDDEEAQFPKEVEGWEEFLQEMIQATHEIIGTAIPFDIKIWEVNTENNLFELQPNFEHRTIKIKTEEKEKHLQWDVFLKLMKVLFTLEQLHDLATTKKPNNKGLHFSFQTNEWFSLGKSAIDHSPDGSIHKALLALIQDF